jgi:type IV pilus assembly protein PilC
MSNYAYVAVDQRGGETRGNLEVADPIEAVRRIKEMGLFPTRILKMDRTRAGRHAKNSRASTSPLTRAVHLPFFCGVKPARLAVFTRQLATLAGAGMPLLRSLRVLHEQEECGPLKRIIERMAMMIEEGSSMAEAVAAHPKVFNRLYVSMVKAGEISGAIDVTLTRLAEFIEKAQRIRGRIKAAMFYPCAVMGVAMAIMGLLMAYVVPKFKEVFPGLMDGRPLPPFTRFVFHVSDAVVHYLWLVPILLGVLAVAGALLLKTTWGRLFFDHVKLAMPVVGNLFRKAAISRFARTLGTLASNGVPILQALTIVEETAGNAQVGKLVSRVHENVKQGDPIAPTLKSSALFPAMVAGMVDVGEQTGALPDMLLKIADTYDEEVNNATNALTSLLEPVMIIFLAVIVGGIVIAMFLPLVSVVTNFDPPGSSGAE